MDKTCLNNILFYIHLHNKMTYLELQLSLRLKSRTLPMFLSVSLSGCISSSFPIPNQVTNIMTFVLSFSCFIYSFITQVFIHKQILFSFQKLSYKSRLNSVWRMYYCYHWIIASKNRYKQSSFQVIVWLPSFFGRQGFHKDSLIK